MTFSNNQQSHVAINNNTKKTFQDLYSLFNNKKEDLLKKRELFFENAKELILKKYNSHVKKIFYSEFKRYYEAGDYQAILRLILELDKEKLEIIPRGITRAIDFQQSDSVLFHAVGTLHRHTNGSYKNSSMPPKDYAQLLLKIMREGLKASDRSQYSLKDDFDGALIKELDFCKEIYFWKVKKNETPSSHYFSFPAATAGILFDPHNYCAVHELRKGGSTTVAGMEEHSVLINPKVNISPNKFTLLLHSRQNVTFSTIDLIKNTSRKYSGYEYFEELKRHLDSMGIPYIVV